MRRLRGDRGVAVVEAAFVIPLFVILVLGMVDFGYGMFQDSQATAAARDGARFGILDPTDTAGIEAETQARAIGQVVTVDVECLDGPSGSTAVPCADAVPGEDRIRVTAEWAYEAPTGVGDMFASGRTIKGSSTMVIVGRPVTVTDPTPAPPPPGGDDGGDGGDGGGDPGDHAMTTVCIDRTCTFTAEAPPGSVFHWLTSNGATGTGQDFAYTPGSNGKVDYTTTLTINPGAVVIEQDVSCPGGGGACVAQGGTP